MNDLKKFVEHNKDIEYQNNKQNSLYLQQVISYKDLGAENLNYNNSSLFVSLKFLCKKVNINIKDSVDREIFFLSNIEELEYYENHYKLRFIKTDLESDYFYSQTNFYYLGFNTSGESYILIPKNKRYYAYYPKKNLKVKITKENYRDFQKNNYYLSPSFIHNDFNFKNSLKCVLLNNKRDFSSLILFILVIGILKLITPFVYSKIIVFGAISNDISNLLWIIILFFILSLSITLIKFIQNIILTRIETKMTYNLENSFMDRLLNLNFSFFGRFKTGDLILRMNSLSSIVSSMHSNALSSIINIFYIIFTLILMFYMSFEIALLVFLLTMFFVPIFYFLVKFEYPLIKEYLNLSGDNTGLVEQTLYSIDKVKIFNKNSNILNKYCETLSYKNHNLIKLFYIKYISRILLSNFQRINKLAFLLIIVISFGFNFSLETYIVFTFLLSLYFGYFSSILSSLRSILFVFADIERARPIVIDKLNNLYNDKKNINILGNIALKNINFKYEDNSNYILKDISLDIKQGDFIGIVGLSGCGKSSLIKVLLGVNKLESGKVLYDNHNLDVLNFDYLYKQCGIVLQNDNLITGSIRDNIICNNKNITDDEVYNLLDIVGLKKDILKLPMGLETLISQERITLSGGQIQRLLIARSLRNKPKVLIFDEATSALDSKSQNLISRKIESLKITRIVIAHRVSTIKNANKIYFLNNGKFIEQGSFDELKKKGTLFKHNFL